MRSRSRSLAAAVAVAAPLSTACAAFSAADPLALAAEARAAERAFATTMAARDLAGFASHVAEDAVFLGGQRVLRGKATVVDAWKRFFEGPAAPFSWEPEKVEALDSGSLALSTGPVYDPQGRRIGTFNSIWRREADGRWRVVFDNGCPECECPPAAP
jgi:ketosteroid isomerase-like protein